MIAKRVYQGEQYPRGYGFAYHEWSYGRAVCYPVGLNWLVGAIHEAWIRLRHGPFHNPDRHARELSVAYQTGRTDGLRDYAVTYAAGTHEGWRQVFEQMEQQLTTPTARAANGR